MKRCILPFIFPVVFLLTNCEKNIYNEVDPRFYNDAMHGNIVGKVLQTSSNALVIASQVKPIDSALIDPNDGSFAINNLPIGNYDLTIKADNYRIYKNCNVMVEGAGNTYIGEVDLSTVPDLVSSHYPGDKDEIAFNNRFARLTVSMTFTQPMDRESVENAFSTDPPTEGVFYWGQYSSAPSWNYFEDSKSYANGGFDQGATITTYSKITSFSYRVAQKDSYTDTTYNITLSTEAQDTAGNYLRFPLEFSFSTVQSSSTLNGIQTNPYHGDIYVDLISYSGISITFPRNMDQASTENAITVTPDTDPIYIWPQSNELTIYTGGAFRADTTYVITIDSTAKDLDGVKMGDIFSFSFSTTSVDLSYSYPNNGELFVSRSSDIRLVFNTYMVKSFVQSAFNITPAISGSLYWDNDSKTTMEFIHGGLFQPNTKYTVTIGTEAKDIFGSHMKEPYVFSFITRPD
jgi:hypothetical protein